MSNSAFFTLFLMLLVTLKASAYNHLKWKTYIAFSTIKMLTFCGLYRRQSALHCNGGRVLCCNVVPYSLISDMTEIWQDNILQPSGTGVLTPPLTNWYWYLSCNPLCLLFHMLCNRYNKTKRNLNIERTDIFISYI